MARRGRSGPKRANAKQRVKTARGRSNSSTRWLQRQLNDPYVQDAKRIGYRSRAAFKLIDIDAKYRLLRRGAKVIDLGAAPGGSLGQPCVYSSYPSTSTYPANQGICNASLPIAPAAKRPWPEAVLRRA